LKRRTTILTKVNGSTLIEVIVAMLISTIVFFFTITIIVNLLGGTRLIQNYHRDVTAQSILREPVLPAYPEEVRYKDDDGIVFYKKITPYVNDPFLLLVTVECVGTSGNTTSTFRTVVKNPNDPKIYEQVP
jgi:hypothetical protein